MANKALDILYNWAKSTGYEKSPDDFYNLISTNKDAFNRVYNYAKETGYQRDENAFAGLVGIQMAPPVEPIRRSEEGAAPTPVTMEGEGTGEQPMPDAPETGAVEIASEKPMSDAKTAALESDLNNKLLPVTENTQIKEVPTDTGKMTVQSPAKKRDFLEAADEVLYRIYNSPGYLKKLENEIAQSKDFNKDYDPKALEELNASEKNIMQKIRSLKPEAKEENNLLMDELRDINEAKRQIYEKISLIGGKYSTTELANERRKRVETTKVNLDEDGGDSAGAMRRSYTNERPEANAGLTVKDAEEYERKLEEFTSKEQPLTTDIYLDPEIHKSDAYKTNQYPSED
jgi:hypothetical protein